MIVHGVVLGLEGSRGWCPLNVKYLAQWLRKYLTLIAYFLLLLSSEIYYFHFFSINYIDANFGLITCTSWLWPSPKLRAEWNSQRMHHPVQGKFQVLVPEHPTSFFPRDFFILNTVERPLIKFISFQAKNIQVHRERLKKFCLIKSAEANGDTKYTIKKVSWHCLWMVQNFREHIPGCRANVDLKHSRV